MSMHRALNSDDLTTGLLRLLQGTNAGRNIVLASDLVDDGTPDRAVDPTQSTWNTPRRSDDPLLDAIRRAARC